MIVLTTPTGRIGRQLAPLLLDAGCAVRVVARDPGRLDAAVRDRVEIVTGRHDDAAVMAAALDGADALFWVAPPDPEADSVQRSYVRFAQAAVDGVRRAGGRARVVAVSSLGYGYRRPAGQLSAAFAAEDALAAGGVALRALRLPFFMDNLLHQVEPLAAQGLWLDAHRPDRVLESVATRDVARVAADVLLDASWSGRGAIPVVGPDRLTPTAMTAVMAEALGRPIRLQTIPVDDYRRTMLERGARAPWADALAELIVAQDDGIYDREPRDGQRVGPTTFRRWCEEVLAPALRR